MTVAALSTLLVVWIAAIVSPGPDTLQIIRLGARSRADGVWCALGICVGNTLWIVASLIGLSALMTTHPGLLHILQIIGGSYLTWIAVKSIRVGITGRKERARVWANRAGTTTVERATAPAASFRTGLATNLSNPKAVLFFAAIFAQFVDPEGGLIAGVTILLILTVTGVAWFVGFALAVRTLAVRIIRNAPLIDLVSGVVFALIAAYMLLEGLHGVATAV
ncbi:LysE family translocator [Corynebacterium sp. CCM 9185]|uniref:LysE family translocator n=1 Tax=Corynebacterium marambiense TaxID=2765364 RepID=A0ABS0VSJ8_9CORY|nr:LysE family translocator [Corynebacterium marambiense]MBI8999717.1 LysE family translocator [Corynebacterium marambiense]MCK7662559.1 LysE family translocator [Corynebacterium marambiense]MCX7541847.1 LysE family translocator [Corynebacterium marambiense]